MPIIVDPAVITQIQNDIQDIENELGVDPNGVYSTVRTRLDILEARINNPLAPAPNVENPFYIGNDGVSISTGDGYPTENRVNGSLYLRKDGYANEGLYSRSAGVWNLVGSGGGGGGFTAGGDLFGTSTSQTVIGIQGNPVASSMPSSGEVLTYYNSNWEPKFPAVVYDTLSAESNIKRSVGFCIIDNTKTGITNLSNNGTANDNYTAILGGESNLIEIGYSSIVGGLNNSILAAPSPSSSDGYSFIAGGDNNIIDSANYSSILSGDNNEINSGNYSAVLSGNYNIISDSLHAIIISGYDNTIGASSVYNTIINGYTNDISASASYNTIISGFNNSIDTSSLLNIIRGQANSILSSSSNNNIFGNSNTIQTASNNVNIFGINNTAQASSSSTIILGNSNNARFADTQVFGNSNISPASSINSFIKGSSNNVQGNRDIIFGNNNTTSNRSNNSVIFGAGNFVGTNSGGNGGNFILGDSNTFGTFNDRNLILGHSNIINNSIDDSVVLGSFNTSNSNYSFITGIRGKSNYVGQFVHATNAFSTAYGYSQYSRVILTGSKGMGASFDLTVNGSNLTLEDDKAYDICIRILVLTTSGTFTCAQYVYDILAHQSGGTLTLDNTNLTLIIDNGTSWTVTIAGGSNLAVTVDAFGSDNRRAIATVEWRELSRL